MTAIKLNEITIHTIGHWPLHIRVITLFLLGFGLLVCGFTVFVSSNYEEWETANKNYRMLKDEWVNKKQKLKHSYLTIQERKKLDEMWLDLIERLGEPIPLADVLQSLEHLAHANRVHLKNVKQLSVKKQNDLTTLPLQIIMSGNAISIKKFLHDIAQLKRIMVIDQFLWTNGHAENNETELTLTANLFAYELPPDIVNDNSKVSTARLSKNNQTILPFSIKNEFDKSESDNQALTKVSLDKIILSGIIQQNEKYWALLMTPDNKVHAAIVGEKVGLNSGIINKISAAQVEVVEQLTNGKQVKYFVLSLEKNKKMADSNSIN